MKNYSLIALLFFCFSKSVAQEVSELEYKVIDTFITNKQTDMSEALICSYNDNEFIYASALSPFVVEQINVRTRERKVYHLPVNVSKKSILKSVHGNDKYIGVVLSDKIFLYDKKEAKGYNVILNNEETYEQLQFIGDQAMLAGAYNFHIVDGWPMLQLAMIDLKSMEITKRNRLFFSGIRFTHTVHNFLCFSKQKLFVLKPLSNYVQIVDTSLMVVDSFKITDNLPNQANIANVLDAPIHHEIEMREKGSSKLAMMQSYTPSKEDIMNLKELDSSIFRNEKIYCNDDWILITQKAFGVTGWSKRTIYIYDSKLFQKRLTLHSWLNRETDFFKPIFVNSVKNFLIGGNTLLDIRNDQFYDPSIKDKPEYNQKYEEWAKLHDDYFATIFLYKLKLK